MMSQKQAEVTPFRPQRHGAVSAHVRALFKFSHCCCYGGRRDMSRQVERAERMV